MATGTPGEEQLLVAWQVWGRGYKGGLRRGKVEKCGDSQGSF